MSDNKQNPFAEPEKTSNKNKSSFEFSDLEQQAKDILSWKFFTAGRRIGRLRYISYTLGAVFIGSALGLLAYLIPIIGPFISALMLIATFIAIAIFTVQRAHDFNLHTLIALALMFVMPLLTLILYFIPGNNEDNKYGAPPPENSTAVVVFATLLPILYVLIIVALISLVFSIPLCLFCS